MELANGRKAPEANISPPIKSTSTNSNFHSSLV